MVLYTRVLKEPRGFIRIIQCIFAILAFSTTVGFDTTCSFSHECAKSTNAPEVIKYSFGYPFLIREHPLRSPRECDHDDEEDDHKYITLPYDYSETAEFYVATGVLSFLYTIIALLVYVFLHQTYSTNTKVPVIDLAISAIISVFWLAGSSAWAQGVRGLKYLLHPENLFSLMTSCQENGSCKVEHDGEYAELNVSLIFGFSCFVLWLSGLWFVYKETVFHTPPEVVQDTTQAAKGDGRV